MDCKVGEWSPWSPCSATCGSSGTSSRRRSVLRPESNGGKRCPLLKEERACTSDQPCPARHGSRRHHHRMNRLGKVQDSEETAVLLPGKYARRYNPGDYDVRFNLKSFKPKDMEKENFQ